MTKIVINKCYGGFGLSRQALDMYCAAKGIDPGKWNENFFFYDNIHEYDIQRDDPDLVRVVEKLGEEAFGGYAELKVVEIPDDVQWQLMEYDGAEWIAERHRTWS